MERRHDNDYCSLSSGDGFIGGSFFFSMLKSENVGVFLEVKTEIQSEVNNAPGRWWIPYSLSPVPGVGVRSCHQAADTANPSLLL